MVLSSAGLAAFFSRAPSLEVTSPKTNVFHSDQTQHIIRIKTNASCFCKTHSAYAPSVMFCVYSDKSNDQYLARDVMVLSSAGLAAFLPRAPSLEVMRPLPPATRSELLGRSQEWRNQAGGTRQNVPCRVNRLLREPRYSSLLVVGGSVPAFLAPSARDGPRDT
jgi:hypothetical protein